MQAGQSFHLCAALRVCADPDIFQSVQGDLIGVAGALTTDLVSCHVMYGIPPALCWRAKMLNLKVHLRRPSSSLAFQLLRSSPARPQTIRHVSYCVLRRARSLTPALRGVKPHHSVHTTVQAPQFSSLSWQLGSVLTGRVKLRPPQWLTVPGSCNVWILLVFLYVTLE